MTIRGAQVDGNRDCFMTRMLLLLAVAFVSSPAVAAERSPNVVLFLVDDLGWTDLGCYGSGFYETPHVDGLADEGVRFAQAYAACHVCSPTRASIMTGKYPARLHMTDWLPGRREFPFQKLKNAPIRQHLPFEEITIAEALKERGYITAHFGKWHPGRAQEARDRVRLAEHRQANPQSERAGPRPEAWDRDLG